jgi:drug/metabolite transporter (DMT)-like permease
MNKGILYIILSSLAFVIVNFFVKLLGGGPDQLLFQGLQKYPAHELVLARSIVSFSISLYIIKRKGYPVFGYNKKWLIVRGVAGMVALTIFFYTLHHLPLAIASTIQYLSPIFTVLLALIILKERIIKMQWLFIILSFIGVALISFNNFFLKNSILKIDYTWLLLGILSAAFSGLAYTAIVKLKGRETPINIVLYFPMIAIPVMTFWCFFDFVMPRGIEWLILLIIGIFTQIAQILMTRALHEEKSSIVTPFQYLGAIYAALIGYFIYDEKVSLIVYLGILLILLGVISNTLIRKR